MLSLPSSLFLGSILSCVDAATWATLPMNVAPYLTESNYIPSTIPVLVGTPPQQTRMNLTVDLASGVLATYGSDCILCAGTTMFDPSLSSTFKVSMISSSVTMSRKLGRIKSGYVLTSESPTNNTPWPYSIPSFRGVDVSDSIGFGGLFSAADQLFANILNGSNQSIAIRVWNGYLGLFLNPLSTTSIAQHILTRLHQSSSLLNPVVGMRFDPANPKLTIGALDPNDYEGMINWVQLEQAPDVESDYFNIFSFDGVKGYNGSFILYSGNLTAALDSFFSSIAVPNASIYFNDPNFFGPVPLPIGLIPEIGQYEYNCTTNSSSPPSATVPPQWPYAALTATINGVDYPIDSPGNLLGPPSVVSSDGFCPVGIKSRTDVAQPSVLLGLPFLRSVYLAYRFPTDDCPGYYGFAFPVGSNRTQSQISQMPRATPTNSAQCLSLVAPTSTPTASVVLAQQALLSKATYKVYGRQGMAPVPLLDVDNLPQTVWNWTAL